MICGAPQTNLPRSSIRGQQEPIQGPQGRPQSSRVQVYKLICSCSSGLLGPTPVSGLTSNHTSCAIENTPDSARSKIQKCYHKPPHMTGRVVRGAGPRSATERWSGPCSRAQPVGARSDTPAAAYEAIARSARLGALCAHRGSFSTLSSARPRVMGAYELHPGPRGRAWRPGRATRPNSHETGLRSPGYPPLNAN